MTEPDTPDTTEPTSSLLVQAPARLPLTVVQPGHHGPAGWYLASLTTNAGRRSQACSLSVLARVLTGQPDPEAVPWHLLDGAQTSAIRSYLIAGGLKPRTVNRYLAALRGVLRAAWQRGMISRDEYERLTQLRQMPVGLAVAGRQLSTAEQGALFAACDDGTRLGSRDAALLALLVGAGLRAFEACAATLDDWRGERVYIGQGKGHKEGWGWLSPGARLALEAWRDVRGLEPGPLVCRLTRSDVILRPLVQLSTMQAWRSLRARAIVAGVANVSPHDLRRTYLSDLCDLADLSTVSKMARHASVNQTAGYDRRDEHAQRAAIARLVTPYTSRRPPDKDPNA